MQDFVHLHVHTQYSLLDGQASVARLVDKAMKNGMKGIAVTDHGNMFGIKEFTNYVNKKNSGPKGEVKDLKKRIAGIEAGTIECEDKEAEIAACKAKIVEAENKLFKPIIGCEMYVARRTMDLKEGKPDQSGYHLIVLAKNETGYHNLIKLVSHAWTRGYYMRPRTDRSELEKYHEGLIICSACLGGEGSLSPPPNPHVSVVRCRNGLLPGNLPKRRKQYNGIRTCLAMTTIWSYNAIKRLFPVPITNATRCR